MTVRQSRHAENYNRRHFAKCEVRIDHGDVEADGLHSLSRGGVAISTRCTSKTGSAVAAQASVLPYHELHPSCRILSRRENTSLSGFQPEWENGSVGITVMGGIVLDHLVFRDVTRKYLRGSQVAPSCPIEGGSTGIVEKALSAACSSRVYHPESEIGDRKSPHFALWHEGMQIWP